MQWNTIRILYLISLLQTGVPVQFYVDLYKPSLNDMWLTLNVILQYCICNRIACIYCAVSSRAIILKLHSFNSLGHSNIQ